MNIRVEDGDCLDAMRRLAREGVRVHSVVTDPPYHLVSIVKRFGADNATPAKSNGASGVYKRTSAGFMGQKWDGGGIAFEPETWRLCYDLLPPGGHLLAFGGTRTYHRLVCAIENAGFEIRDTIAWLYGTGFPKSHNLDGEWNGWGTALKPALELICVARKPLIGTVAENVQLLGTGALNIDGCRIETASQGPQNSLPGRWPANVCHDGSEEVLQAFPAARGQIAKASVNVKTRKTRNVYGAMTPSARAEEPRGDSGSAARFFYCPKASKADRAGSKHPTVKPTALLRWLTRLVTPPGGTVLDPFAGTGTTGAAAYLEGFDAVLIEREASYLADIRRRLAALGKGYEPPLAHSDFL